MTGKLTRRVAQTVALTMLFSVSAVYESVHLSAFSSAYVWMHLRAGTWILANHSVPRSGLFSQHANLPWHDASWLFDAVLAALYQLLGLRALPILLMSLKVAFAAIVFLLARAKGQSIWIAIFLSAAVQYVLGGLQPAAYVVSILLFAVELHLLVESRRSGNVRLLFWLPPLFLAWANLHIQVVAGLILMGLFVVALLVEFALRKRQAHWLSAGIQPLPLETVAIVAVVSVMATLANPYGYRLFAAVSTELYSAAAFKNFTEMASMSFRRPQDFVLMLVVMAAFLALGRKRSLELFGLMVLIVGTLVAFRIQRDSWFALLPAVAVLGGGVRWKSEIPPEESTLPQKDGAWVALLVLLVFAAAALRIPREDALTAKVAENFPVNASSYIRENHLPPPLLNAYPWGGFLAWYLPEYPVAIDTRVELYGDDILASYFTVTNGKERLEADATVANARTLILVRQSAMAKALVNLPALSAQYRLVYSDNLASVFVRR